MRRIAAQLAHARNDSATARSDAARADLLRDPLGLRIARLARGFDARAGHFGVWAWAGEDAGERGAEQEASRVGACLVEVNQRP